MGTYSSNIPRDIAIRLVVNKNHPAFKQLFNNFWLALGDKKLHYGKDSLEGTIKLNKIGLSYYKKEFRGLY